MPDVVYSNEGEREAARLIFKAELVVPRVWHLRLFKNNYSPNRDTVLGQLTEATFAGYSPIAIDPALWSDPATVGGTAVTFYGATYSQWLASSGTQDIYGWYITFNNGASLFLSQRFDDKQTVTTSIPVVVFPELTDHSEYNPAPPP